MCNMFCSPRSISTIRRSLFGLYTLKQTIFPKRCFIGSKKEPYVICALSWVVFMGIYVVEYVKEAGLYYNVRLMEWFWGLLAIVV